MANNTFYHSFKARSYTIFSTPILVELFERKMTLKQLINLLAKNGFIYKYDLLKIVLRGKATNNFTLHYFTHIYRVLNLPMPTPEYLFNCHQRLIEIKAFKLDRRNANRIKKGLLPVNSISTRIK